jgi:peptide/nickel transport system permease protein
MSIQQIAAPEPTTAGATAPITDDSGVGEVSQLRLMYRRFKRSKLALISIAILALIYIGAIFAPFFSPNAWDANNVNTKYAKPSSLTWSGGPAMCKTTQGLNTTTFTFEYKTDCKHPVKIHFFGKGYHYKLLGLIPTSRHLFTVDKPNKIFIWGADSNGQDVFARALRGARISMTIGLVTAAMITIIGGVIGTISGYLGGWVDTLIQRIIEVILSIPTLPLWMTLSAVLPREWSVGTRFIVMSLILAGVGWPGLARQMRGKVLSYSRADYVSAARAAGSGPWRIIRTHLIPNAASHIVATAMLAIPLSILAETTLSFLGLGMQKPGISWGVMLLDAQQLSTLTLQPWLLIPAALVVVAVACFQFVGDGVRDAVDPYG